MDLQPLLNDLLVALVAPTQVWSDLDGQVRPRGAQGCYHHDLRVLSSARVLVGGIEPEHLTGGAAGTGVVETLALARNVDERGADPTVRLRRVRTVRPGDVKESLLLEVATAEPVRTTVELHLASDLASMGVVKSGRVGTPQVAMSRADGVRWVGAGTEVTVVANGAEVDLADPCAPVLRWHVEASAAQPWSATWTMSAVGAGVVLPAEDAPSWSVPEVVSDDRRLPRLVQTALADLHALRMRAAFAPQDVFLAAGAPWFFTLFGRDSIWAARMLLPLGTTLAGGTLRTLAARQGLVDDPATAEQPGKILHEVRSGVVDLGDGAAIPPLYYGTVDATPLWVCLLHDAWRWGMPREEVSALLPAMEAALEWMVDYGDADGDGFLEYLDVTGTGLANQGWKDSGDSVQWRDGTLATGPIALCEVQAYAYEAALAGADLLDAFDRPGAERWRAWAARLATRFREHFWVRDEDGAYPAIALDAAKRPVDSLTSNIGHLLGTGLLSAAEEALVAERLTGPAMDSGYGLRTMATHSGGYWPMRYHGGSVWTHDTAITVAGLSRSGRGEQAARFIEGLLAAGAELDYRLPELHGGDARGSVPAVVPYPSACRPQAWSAASAVVLLTSVLGLEPDAPGGRLRVNPIAPSPVGALQVSGLRLAGYDLCVDLAADGTVLEATTGAPVVID